MHRNIEVWAAAKVASLVALVVHTAHDMFCHHVDNLLSRPESEYAYVLSVGLFCFIDTIHLQNRHNSEGCKGTVVPCNSKYQRRGVQASLYALDGYLRKVARCHGFPVDVSSSWPTQESVLLMLMLLKSRHSSHSWSIAQSLAIF